MTPVGEKILVKPLVADMISAGGIIIPQNCQEDSSKVQVVSVGAGTKKNPMKYKGGEIGYRVKGCGEEYIIDGEKHYLINQGWLIALEKN